MKKTILLIFMIITTRGFSQLPYFQQDQFSATPGINYTDPVDVHYDGTATVYSYHSSNVGTIVTKYNSATGAVTDVVGLYSTAGTFYSPVRVRTFGANYFALFNIPVAGTTRFCIASLNAVTNALNYANYLNNGPNNIDQTGVDFTFDNGFFNPFIYVLSNGYDAVNNQTDLCITKINRNLGVIIWNNRYANISRDEAGSNIIVRGIGQVYASAVTVSTSSFLDRATMLLHVNTAGAYVNSQMYKYNTACIPARVSSTWVYNAPSSLVISSVSFVGADGNGPMYLAKINPTTLAITLQNHFSSATAYLNPEIQPVYTTSGTMILMSGNASFVNTSNPGYVHLFFSPATLAFNQGTLYNTTSSGFVNTAIFDTYTGTAPGFNIFTIASDQTTTTNYYLLKTSELGHDACDTPYNITPGTCTIDHFAIPFTKIFVPATFPHLKKFATKSYANKSIQSCLVSCPGCAISTDNGTSDNNENENKEMVVASSQTEGIKIYPNPAKEMITIESDNALENARLSVYNLLGEKIMDTQMEGTVKTIDISGFNSGIYFVHILVEDEQKIFRVIKQ